MPWNPAQHRLFCAKCNNGKGPADMCRMCHEGQTGKKKTDWRKARQEEDRK